jgi:hypothetical protein
MWEPGPHDHDIILSVEPALVDGVDGLTVLWAKGSDVSPEVVELGS